MKTVKTILIFPNGNIAAFDSDDHQIQELQTKSVTRLIAEHANRMGYSVDGCTVRMGRGVVHMIERSGYREFW